MGYNIVYFLNIHNNYLFNIDTKMQLKKSIIYKMYVINTYE